MIRNVRNHENLCLWRRPKESFPQLTNTDSTSIRTRIFTHTRAYSKISGWNLRLHHERSLHLFRTQSPIPFQQVSPFRSCSRTCASSYRAQTVQWTHVALENRKHSSTGSSDITWHSPLSWLWQRLQWKYADTRITIYKWTKLRVFSGRDTIPPWSV